MARKLRLQYEGAIYRVTIRGAERPRRKLQTAYTVYYNLRDRRSGHLMQGRFGAQPVERNPYLLKLSRYIHLDPVCGLVGIDTIPALARDRVKHTCRLQCLDGLGGGRFAHLEQLDRRGQGYHRVRGQQLEEPDCRNRRLGVDGYEAASV